MIKESAKHLQIKFIAPLNSLAFTRSTVPLWIMIKRIIFSMKILWGIFYKT